MLGDVQREIQQMGEDRLGHAFRGVAGHVGHDDAPLARGRDIDDVVAGRRDADVFQVRQLGERLARKGHFVREHDFRILPPDRRLLGRRAIVE